VTPPRGGVTAPRLLFFLLATFALFFLGACGNKKPLAKSELRSITSEITAAAEKAAGPKSPVTIRPEIQQPFTGDMGGGVAADHIYVSVGSASQAVALKASLAGIARRHRLTLAEVSSPGVERFDLAFNGHRTHSVHMVTPLVAMQRPLAPRMPRKGGSGAGAPKLAIILDDLGYDRAAADSLLALPFPLTVSVLPHLPLSSEVAEEAFRRGDEVLLHLPMQSEGDSAKTEDVELRVGMSAEQVDTALAGMLETVPHVVGVNNHQGSRATADPALMAELMPALRGRNLFFIDSRTTASTVAFDAAERAGVPAASRKVFLDDTQTREAIVAQIELAARDAARDGSAIAIGHPHGVTIAALSEEVPRLEARGIRLVFANDVLR
jgi:polysaccharide deacetylase 2 family uncharacterized protein YibQ